MKTLSTVAVFLALITAHGQGPIDGFYKGKNKLDVAFSGGYQSTDTYIGSNGAFTYNRKLGQASIFAEYGITTSLDVIATLPFIGGGFQDYGLYLKKRLFKRKGETHQFSLAGGYSGPASNYATQSGTAIGQQARQFISKLVYQVALPKGFYFQCQGGYNYNLNPVPSSYVFAGKLMYGSDKWYFDFWLANQTGLGDKYYPNFNADFRQLNVSFTQIGGTLYRTFSPKWGAFLNFSQIVQGKGTFLTSSVNAGFVYKFDFNSSDEKKEAN